MGLTSHNFKHIQQTYSIGIGGITMAFETIYEAQEDTDMMEIEMEHTPWSVIESDLMCESNGD